VTKIALLRPLPHRFGRELVAWNAALLSDMIYTQPVLYEFGGLRMPVLLLIGDKDTTAFGKDVAAPRGTSDSGQLSEAGKGSRESHPACASGRIP
jgi:hypothetical protein